MHATFRAATLLTTVHRCWYVHAFIALALAWTGWWSIEGDSKGFALWDPKAHVTSMHR
jgi:hypothetical protein